MHAADNLWAQVEAQVSTRRATDPDAGLGLWAMIVPEAASGLWDELDSETLHLWHTHDDHNLWLAASDETLILPKEGLLPVWAAALAHTTASGEADPAHTLRLVREDVANVWSRSAEETLRLHRPAASIFAQQVRARDLASYHPQRIPGYALKRLTDARGDTYWVLKNLRSGEYLRLTAEQVFLWEQMDGNASVQDIAVAYMLEYGRLAIGGLIVLLDQLQQKGFIAPLVDVYGAADRSLAARRSRAWWRRLGRAFLHTEIAIDGINAWVARSYRWGGRVLFSPVLHWLMLAVIAAGGAAFIGLLLGVIERDMAVIAGAGAAAALSVASLYALQAITLLVHEWSHALATTHYGREVRRGGFLVYLGMPAAFVDTTDIWMEPRRPRIVVSWAGPHSGFVLGGLASLLIVALPAGAAQSVLYRFAILTYLTSFWNLNPLLKLDGYYILMDWLEIPRLREKSLAFVATGLWRKLLRREGFSRDDRIFAVFGLFSALWTAIALAAVMITLGGWLVAALHTTAGLIIAGIVLAALAGTWLRRRMGRTT